MREKELKQKWYRNADDYDVDKTLGLTDDNKHHLDIILTMSGRDRAKSFNISAFCIRRAWYDGKQFAYVRRTDEEINKDMIESYFADKKQYISDMTDGEANKIIVMQGRIIKKLYFAREEYDEKKQCNVDIPIRQCGIAFALFHEEKIKSMQFPELFYIIFEEVFASRYLKDEPAKLISIRSTFCRGNKQGFICFLITNTVSRKNPYAEFFQVDIRRLKAGESVTTRMNLDEYEDNGNQKYILLYWEYLANRANMKGTKKADSNNLVANLTSNDWQQKRQYKTIPLYRIKSYLTHELVAVFECDGLKMQAELVIIPVELFEKDIEDIVDFNNTIPQLYIFPKTTPVHDETRLYTNRTNSISPYTTSGLVEICPLDKAVIELIERGWLIYSDNLTGNEFEEMLTELY